MVAPGFLSRTCPVELLLEIFKQLPSTQDALSFALTCRHINDVWCRNATSILLALWRRNSEFPAVEEALIAARMTKVVVEAEQADRLPPTDVRPGDFSINDGGAPTILELQSARALHHLARALSVAFCHHNVLLPTGRQWRVDNHGNQISGPLERTPEELSRMPEWSARVHKAIYRTMIAGAALAGIYNEPLYKAKTHSDTRIQRLACVKKQREEESNIFLGPDALSYEDYFAFLNGFPVCRITLPPDTEDQLFGPLAAWLVDNILSDKQGREAMAKRFAGGYGRADLYHRLATSSVQEEEPSQECPLTSVEGGRDHPDAHLVLWEVMQIAWAFIHILGTLQEDPRPRGDEQKGEVQGGGMEGFATVEAVAVFFGAFKAQQIIVPKHLESFIEHPTFRFRFMNCEGVDGTSTYSISSKPGSVFPTDPDPYSDPWGWNDVVKDFSGQTMVIVKHFEDIYYGSQQPNCWIDPGPDDSGYEYKNYTTPLLFKFFEYTLERHLGATFALDIFRHEHVWWHEELFSVFLWDLAVFAHDDEDLWKRAGVLDIYAFTAGEKLVVRCNDRRPSLSSLLVYRPNEEWEDYYESQDESESPRPGE